MKHELCFFMALITCCLSRSVACIAQPNVAEPAVRYNVIQEKQFHIVGIACKTTNGPAAMRDIAALWQRFFQEDVAQQIPNKSSDEVFALYCDYEGDFTKPYLVLIGCPVESVNSIPEGFTAKSVPSAAYAEFICKGEMPQCVIDTWQTIWKSDLDRLYIGDMEIYRDGTEGARILVGIH